MSHAPSAFPPCFTEPGRTVFQIENQLHCTINYTNGTLVLSCLTVSLWYSTATQLFAPYIKHNRGFKNPPVCGLIYPYILF